MNPITLLTQFIIGLAIASATEVGLHYSFPTTLVYLNYWALAFAIITPILFLAVGYLHSLSEQVNASGASRVQYQLFERLQNCYDHGLIALTLPLSCLLLTFRVAHTSPALNDSLLGVMGVTLLGLGVAYFFVLKGKADRFTSKAWVLLPLVPIVCLVVVLAVPSASQSMSLFSLVGAGLGFSTEAVILMIIDLLSIFDLTSDSRSGYQNAESEMA